RFCAAGNTVYQRAHLAGGRKAPRLPTQHAYFDGRYRGNSGPHLLTLSLSVHDPERTWHCPIAPFFRGKAGWGHERSYSLHIDIPLKLSEASRPTAGPRTLITTPLGFRSVATLAPPTTAIAAEPCVYVPAMSAAVRRLEAVPTKSTADAPMVPTFRPPMLSRY